VIDRNTLAVINDNDFDINGGTFDAAGIYSGPGARSKVLTIHLASPLPLASTAIQARCPAPAARPQTVRYSCCLPAC
jgi:hypothetical protein